MTHLESQRYYFVIFGVSGSGKSSIGEMLAKKLNIEFIEGDDFHPKENVEKMKAGHPLTDADRAPWLSILQQKIATQIDANQGFVLSCSALKVKYRNELRKAEGIQFLFLDVAERVAAERLRNRKNHFMPAALLNSQIQLLERPKQEENDVILIDASKQKHAIVEDIMNRYLS